MNTRIILETARALIINPEHWTQGNNAIENTGAPCGPKDANACAWCASGALIKAAGDNDFYGRAAGRELADAAMRLYGAGFMAFVDVNDGELGNPETAHANIIAVFDNAIARA